MKVKGIHSIDESREDIDNLMMREKRIQSTGECKEKPKNLLRAKRIQSTDEGKDTNNLMMREKRTQSIGEGKENPKTTEDKENTIY